MAETADHDQKTEAPTPKRTADAARDGDILQSRELATAVMMLMGAGWVALAGPWFIRSCSNMLKSGLTFGSTDIRVFDPALAIERLLGLILPALASLLAVTILAAIAGPAVLGSLGFRSAAIGFKGNRMNPLSGIKRVLGLHGLIELAKALAKAAILGLLGWWLVAGDLRTIMALNRTDIVAAAPAVGSIITRTLLWMGLGLFVIAGIDVPIQIVQRLGRLHMTKQEVRDEARQSESSPETKRAQRQRQHDILSGSARKAMADATLVLTNPTHFAVALRYRPGVDVAPTVVARGRGEVALAIRSLASENAVPMLEYPALARAIYFTSRAGQTVNEELYVAVATILAFVFNLERAMAEGVAQPLIEVPDAKRFDENGKPAAD
jgi:flagellar biosynthesis protein FlhB